MKRRLKRVIKWLATVEKAERLRAPFMRLIRYALAQRNEVIVAYHEPERARGFALIQQVRSERSMLLSVGEAFTLLSVAGSTSKLDGDLAEVGVYQGGSAKLICEVKGGKDLHLFDTFGGLPQPGERDSKWFASGQFAASLDSVREYLKGYGNVHYYKGLFPQTAEGVNDRRFCFANIDADLYQPTRAALEFFWPRLVPGGVLIAHDYGETASEGVTLAVREYFASVPVPVMVFDTQCLVVKI